MGLRREYFSAEAEGARWISLGGAGAGPRAAREL
jgi:hypothetical protein